MPEHQQQHLYLLFDDWDSGYSIRKLSLSRRSGKRPLSSGSGKEGVAPVPEVFMRIRAPRGFPDLFTSAFGTKIMVMHPGTADDTAGIPMIDVQEQTFSFGPQPSRYHCFPIYFPVGDKLFILDICTFDCYLWTPEHGEEPWGWQDLPYPPFERADVSSYGMQPDGCILVSTKRHATFVFDTDEYVWKKPYDGGNWALPFAGRAHYDTSLEGFVGLSKHPETLGYILYCSTSSTTGTDGFKCTTTKEKVYNKTEGQHVSATLVHMLPGKFCLVECVSIDNGGRTGQELSASWAQEFKLPLGASAWDFVGGGPQGGRFMYRLKTFSLSYDTKGDCLRLKNCKVRCYSLPHEARIGSVCMDPVAFWL